MALLTIRDIGKIGVVKDTKPYLLPPNAWSDVRNVTFVDGAVKKGSGYQLIASGIPTTPRSVFIHKSTNTPYYYVYLSQTAAYSHTGAAEAVITRAAGAYAADVYPWIGGSFDKFLVVANYKDVPQSWDPAAVPGTLMVDLVGWQSGVRCLGIRPFKNYLVAFTIEKAGTAFPKMVKWSHLAAPGALPTSWDEADPTVDAGENVLSESGGQIWDCLRLGDSLLVYTESDIWAMRLIGAPYIFSFNKLFDFGSLSTGTMCAITGGKHFVVTGDDVVIHDGTSAQSVVHGGMKKWLFDQLTPTISTRVRVVNFRRKNEIWVCFPIGTLGGVHTYALVFNYITGAWSVVDMPLTRGLTPHPETGLQFEMPAAFVGVAETAKKLFAWNDGLTTNDTAAFTSYVERKGLCPRPGKDGSVSQDSGYIYMVTEMWPNIEAAVGTAFSIQFGYHDTPDGTVTWDTAQTFTVGTDVKVSPSDGAVTGRFLAIKVSHAGTGDFKFNDYQLDVATLGKF